MESPLGGGDGGIEARQEKPGAAGSLHDPAERAYPAESLFATFKVATVRSQALKERSLLDWAPPFSSPSVDLPSTLKAFNKIKLKVGSQILQMINLSGRQLRYLL